MRFLDLLLTNFGGHKELRCPDLNVPIIGIAGTNGAGKTTVIRALRYILTGDLPEDNAQSYMLNGGIYGTTVARSRVLANGETGVITRKITKSGQSRELVWENAPPVTKDADVQTKMRSVLGADLTTIGNAVFVPQGKLDELLFSTEAVREQQFLRMIGCAHFENVARTAAKEASQLLASAPDVEGTLAECRAQMRDFTSRWDELRKAAESFPDVSDSLTWLRGHMMLVAAADAARQQADNAGAALRALVTQAAGATNSAVATLLATQAEEALGALQAELDKYVKADNTLRTTLGSRRNYDIAKAQLDSTAFTLAQFAGYTDRSDEFARELSRVQGDGTAARVRKEAATKKREQAQQLAAKAETQQRLKQAVASMEGSEPARPTQEDADGISALRAQLKLIATLAQHVHAPGSVVTCPLCDSPLDARLANPEHARSLETTLKRMQFEFEDKQNAWTSWQSQLMTTRHELQATMQDLRQLQELCGVHDVTLLGAEEEEAQLQLTALTQQYRTVQQSLNEELPRAKAYNNAVACHEQATSSFERLWRERAVEMEAVDIAALEHELGENTKRIETTRTAQKEARAKRDNLLTLTQQLKNAEQNQEHAILRRDSASQEVQRSVAAMPVALAAYQSMPPTDVLALLEKAQEDRTRAIGASDEMQSTIDALTVRVVELQAQRDKNAKARYTAERLNLLAAAFQRDGISRHYTAAVYAKLLTLVSQHLENLDANFTIRRAEGVLSFEFLRNDKEDATWLPQHKLSGGQRVRMAIAFLLAVQQLILPEVGLLVLDEPTDGLNPEGKIDLRDTLERAAEILESNDAQMIICDHSGTLDSVYRATITL